MYRENFINTLQTDLVGMVAAHLTPVALRYGYADTPLENNVKWRPHVLVLGNYSSGKSTLINEFLGAYIQTTGQAPTDDSFTVITGDDSVSDDKALPVPGSDPDSDPDADTGDKPEKAPHALPEVTDERDGNHLLAHPDYPYDMLRKYGDRFASHFKMKCVNAPLLKDIAIIDTPGMLDSISEKDRGYNYMQVIGDLAHIADLVLVLFDPHKAGTVRESHVSLRDILPVRTFEDRVLFVLNRVDECSSFNDLLKVYGTLCWNLSQMTGRKDIPPIHFTWSKQAAEKTLKNAGEEKTFLYHLQNQQEELKNAISKAPRHHLDRLATFVETHSKRLSHLLEALVNYRLKSRQLNLKHGLLSVLAGLIGGGAAAAIFFLGNMLATTPLYLRYGISGVVGLAVLLLWVFLIRKNAAAKLHKTLIDDLDNLTSLNNQNRKDSWKAVRSLVLKYLQDTGGRFSLGEVKQEYKSVHKIFLEGTREVREDLRDLSIMKGDAPAEYDEALAEQSAPPASE